MTSFNQALDVAARAFETPAPAPVTSIPRKATPMFTLIVDRGGQHPEPGTLIVAEAGAPGQLYVGSIRYGAALQGAGITDRARALDHIEIVSTAVTAGREARAWLNRQWKFADALESGLVPTEVADALRTGL